MASRGDVSWGGVVDVHTIRVVRLSALWSRVDVSPHWVSVDMSPQESVGLLLPCVAPVHVVSPNVGLKLHGSKYRPRNSL